MDSLHEAHLSRILEARRRRGVLGKFHEPLAAPPLREYANGVVSPPPLTPFKRRSSSTGTQTADNRRISAAVQTAPALGVPTSTPPFAHSSPGASTAQSDHRQSVPRGNPAAEAIPPLTSPSPKATLNGWVRFRSPGRVPSLAYSTPTSALRRRTDLWRSPARASEASGWRSESRERVRPTESFSSPFYIPRPRSVPRKPLWPERLPSKAPWECQTSFLHAHPLSVAPTAIDVLRGCSYTSTGTSPMAWNQLDTNHLSQEGGGTGTEPHMKWPSRKSRGSDDHHHRSSRHRSRHHCRNSSQPCDHDDGDEGDIVDIPPERHRYSDIREPSPRYVNRQRRADSRRRKGAGRDEDVTTSKERRCGRRGRYHARQRGEVYAPSVVYMGSSTEAEPLSPSLQEGSLRRFGSTPTALPPQRSSRLSRPPALKEGNPTLGLPDAHSTIDLRTSVDILHAGDWFYKWTSKGDSVHRRWFWIDTKSYLLVWSNYETYSPHFCGNVRLDDICQVTSRDLSSVDEDGFPKTYYVLLIETRKRVLQLATELRDKCDAWFDALNNVMGFIHRHDLAKGALIPD
ncbi:hypothetical protein, conserved [Leishmania tarentolae]|uniref:PH domain-containing protein n=1 Tax=Leishmania tarentolae TaxID=5689 RepID=A0A640KK66_LEITA|nr:hypothetical protein, conserved [Leishmania tarentolae]